MMDEQRLEACLDLIQALLDCPSGEEADILNANQALIDDGLVQTMEQVAATLAERGDQNAANWLHSIAAQLAAAIGNSSSTATTEEALNFLLEVLQAALDSNTNPSVVYPLLEANLEKLDEYFAQLLQSWATATLTEVEPEQGLGIVAVINNFSNLIQQFPLGSRASNIEIAITGYKTALQVYTRENFRVDWAMTQNNLGAAYSDRIQGDQCSELGTGN